jgi:tetratricopeptide (TPR) repeat protein
VASVLDQSYKQLLPEQAKVLRLLGLHPGTEFGVAAVGALTDLDTVSMRRRLGALVELDLIELAGHERYRMSDELRAYAARRTELEDLDTDRQEALRRVLTWYARTVQKADLIALSILCSVTLDEVALVGEDITFIDKDAAKAWLQLERDNLVAAIRSASAGGLNELAMTLAVYSRFLLSRFSTLHLESTELGLIAAAAVGNQVIEALLWSLQASTLRKMDRFDESEVAYSRSLALSENLDDPVSRISALSGLGRLRRDQGRLSEAWECYQRSVSLAREAGEPRSEAVALCNLSWICVQQGEFERALEYAEQGQPLRRQAGDSIGEAGTLVDAALAWQGLGRHDTAIGLCRQAIASYQELGYAGVNLADTLLPLATSFEHVGDLPAAGHALRGAITVLADLEDPRAKQTRQRLADLETRIAGS